MFLKRMKSPPSPVIRRPILKANSHHRNHQRPRDSLGRPRRRIRLPILMITIDQQSPPGPSFKAKGQAQAAKARGPNRTRQWKEYNRWSPSHNTYVAAFMSFIRADLDLNKKDGITSLQLYDRKRGNIYGDWTYRHSWNTNNGYIHNTTLLCPADQSETDLDRSSVSDWSRYGLRLSSWSTTSTTQGAWGAEP